MTGNCSCGHPNDRHFSAAESEGLGFFERVCREPGCRCVQSDGHVYERPETIHEQVTRLEARVGMLEALLARFQASLVDDGR